MFYYRFHSTIKFVSSFQPLQFSITSHSEDRVQHKGRRLVTCIVLYSVIPYQRHRLYSHSVSESVLTLMVAEPFNLTPIPIDIVFSLSNTTNTSCTYKKAIVLQYCTLSLFVSSLDRPCNRATSCIRRPVTTFGVHVGEYLVRFRRLYPSLQWSVPSTLSSTQCHCIVYLFLYLNCVSVVPAELIGPSRFGLYILSGVTSLLTLIVHHIVHRPCL